MPLPYSVYAILVNNNNVRGSGFRPCLNLKAQITLLRRDSDRQISVAADLDPMFRKRELNLGGRINMYLFHNAVMRRLAALNLAGILTVSVMAGSVPVYADDETGQAAGAAAEVAENIKTVTEGTVPDNQVLMEALSVSETDLTDLTLERTTKYDGADTAVYRQSYCGVAFYNYTISVTTLLDGKETAVIGHFFTGLDEQLGEKEDFQKAAEAAKEEPEWITEMLAKEENAKLVEIIPYIYIDEETPVLVHDYRILYEEGEYDLILSADDETVYEMREPVAIDEFSDAEIFCKGDSLMAALENSRYYAYSSEYGFAVLNESSLDANNFINYLADNYVNADGKMKMPKTDEIYSSPKQTWETETDYHAFQAMKAFGSVYDWYFEKFGQKGVDNQGSPILLALDSTPSSSPAANALKNGSVFVVSPSDITGTWSYEMPEIYAHEFMHGVLKNRGIYSSNETGALHESLGDLFAVLYSQDRDWKIGVGSGHERNISEGTRTKGTETTDCPTNMKDYKHDSVRKTRRKIEEYDILENLKFIVEFIGDKTYKTSNKVKNINANILSQSMYRIWKNQFDGDFETFGQVLYSAVMMLPAEADFSSMRDCFLASMINSGCDTALVASASASFDLAGIETDGTVAEVVAKMEEPAGAEAEMEAPNDLVGNAYAPSQIAFYGVWVYGESSSSDGWSRVQQLSSSGLAAQVYYSQEWENWDVFPGEYGVSVGEWRSESEAQSVLKYAESKGYSGYVAYTGQFGQAGFSQRDDSLEDQDDYSYDDSDYDSGDSDNYDDYGGYEDNDYDDIDPEDYGDYNYDGDEDYYDRDYT